MTRAAALLLLALASACGEAPEPKRVRIEVGQEVEYEVSEEVTPTGERAEKPAPTGPIDLNTASKEELMTLPGVGEGTAEKIIAARPLASVDDLDRVPGIGAKTMERLRPLVTVAGAGAGAETAAASSDTRARASGGGGGRLNINTATVAELDTLPGIGPTTAQKIVQYRQAHGPFKTVEALTDVPGIGDGTLAKIRDRITI